MRKRSKYSSPLLIIAGALSCGVFIFFMSNGLLTGRVCPQLHCPACKECEATPKCKKCPSLSEQKEAIEARHQINAESRLINSDVEAEGVQETDSEEEPQTVAAVENLFLIEKKKFTAYHALAEAGETLRKEHGPLHIAGFTRLWPPPLHGKGGMQYHAQHLYSRLASLGHVVHVFTTGHPGAGSTHAFTVDLETLKVEKSVSKEAANLWVHQCPSKKNGAYSVMWYKSALEKFHEIHQHIRFDVAHSESWAAVANAAQLTVPLVVTWHGSMLDWFRNEMNQIVQNYRLKGHMTSKSNADRMKSLGESVAYETFALQTVPHHIVISDSAASDLVTADLIPSERVHLVYNGVNEVNFKPTRQLDIHS